MISKNTNKKETTKVSLGSYEGTPPARATVLGLAVDTGRAFEGFVPPPDHAYGRWGPSPERDESSPPATGTWGDRPPWREPPESETP